MKKTAILLSAAVVFFAACHHDPEERPQPAPGVEEETYAGGLLGTTFNQSASAYEDPNFSNVGFIRKKQQYNIVICYLNIFAVYV